MSDKHNNTKAKVAEFFYNRMRKKTAAANAQPFLFENVKSVGIIFDNNHKGLNQFIEDLTKEFKSKSGVISIYQMAYKVGENNKPDANGIPIVYFSEKDVNWYGIPKYKDVTNFLNTEFDLLINLADNNDWTIKFCALMSKSKFKVGTSSENDEVYDLMISNSKDYKATFKLILDTLRIINNQSL